MTIEKLLVQLSAEVASMTREGERLRRENRSLQSQVWGLRDDLESTTTSTSVFNEEAPSAQRLIRVIAHLCYGTGVYDLSDLERAAEDCEFYLEGALT